MQKGFLKLMSTEIDLMHYIEIDNVFYSLTRDHVSKVDDIKQGNKFYIEFVNSLEELQERNPSDPYFLNHPPLTDLEKEAIASSEDCHLITIELIDDLDEVMAFHKFSVDHDFNYFKDIEKEPHQVLLMKYSIVK